MRMKAVLGLVLFPLAAQADDLSGLHGILIENIYHSYIYDAYDLPGIINPAFHSTSSDFTSSFGFQAMKGTLLITDLRMDNCAGKPVIQGYSFLFDLKKSYTRKLKCDGQVGPSANEVFGTEISTSTSFKSGKLRLKGRAKQVGDWHVPGAVLVSHVVNTVTFNVELELHNKVCNVKSMNVVYKSTQRNNVYENIGAGFDAWHTYKKATKSTCKVY